MSDFVWEKSIKRKGVEKERMEVECVVKREWGRECERERAWGQSVWERQLVAKSMERDNRRTVFIMECLTPAALLFRVKTQPSETFVKTLSSLV